MRFALDIYRRLTLIQMRSQIQYRLSFLLEMLTVTVITGISFLTVALVLQKFDGIGGWKLAEIALLYGMIETAFGTMDMIFSGFDPRNFGNQMRLGAFDQMLLRPINIFVQVFGSEFILRRVGRIGQGMIVLVIAFHMLDIQWTATKLVLLPVVFASLIAFFGGLFITGATITFWTIESIEAINILTYGGTEMMAYPMHIYQDWLRRFFTFIIPAIFLLYYPALYWLDKPDPFQMPAWAPLLSPVVGFGMLALSLAFWQVGIRHYQSTGT